MQQPIPLFSGEQVQEEKCSICLDDLSDNKHKITECGHEFHSNCIISWLRSGNTSCPICRNDDGHVYFSFNKERKFICDSMIKYSKKNKIDKKISTLLKNYQKIKKIKTDNNRKLKILRKQNKDTIKNLVKRRDEIRKKYKKEMRENNKELTAARKGETKIGNKLWNIDKKIRDIEKQICMIPICPIKIN